MYYKDTKKCTPVSSCFATNLLQQMKIIRRDFRDCFISDLINMIMLKHS